MASRGKVFLVGAGPGDPGLITVRGLELIRRADVLLVDDLVDPRLAAETRGRIVRAGKSRRRSQQDVIRTMAAEARRGRTVVRLKGGDPFIFGRGGEEALGLRRSRIPYEIVPGITAANAASVCAGIPLTHRGVSSMVVFLTARRGTGSPEIDYRSLPRDATLAIYMTAKTLTRTVRGLRRAGWPGSTPVAFVQWASQPHQKTFTATLDTIARGVRPPALAIVGEVVRLRRAIRWFEERPLFGLTAATTRAERSRLDEMLEAEGARVVRSPAVRILPLRRWAEPPHDWLVFTSAVAVGRYFEELEKRGRDARSISARVAAVGPGTETALHAQGIRADLVPDTFTTRDLGRALVRAGARRILHPCADLASRDLHHKNLEIVDLPLYKLARPSMNGQAGHPDVVLFASAQTARNYLAAHRLPSTAKIVTIGPATSRVVRACGRRVDREARPHTFEGMVAAVRRLRGHR